MKKYIILCVALLFVVGVFILFMLVSSDGSEELSLPGPVSGDTTTPHFTAYELLGDSLNISPFYQFVREPSVESLNRAGGAVRAFSLREGPRETIRVFPELISPIGEHVPNPHTTHITLSFLVCEPFVRFAGDTAELQAFLAEHGVADEIEYAAVVQSAAGTRIISWDEEGREVFDAPVVIWVQAGGESFFIGIEIHTEGFEDIWGTLAYQLYTHSDYLELVQERISKEPSEWERFASWLFGR